MTNPPDSDEILLAELLAGVQDFMMVSGVLSSDDFKRPEHKKIFHRMAQLHGRGEKINQVTVANELMLWNELESCGGLTYLVGLGDCLDPYWMRGIE